MCNVYALCALHVVFLLETGERFNLWKIIIITKRFDWNNLWFFLFLFCIPGIGNEEQFGLSGRREDGEERRDVYNIGRDKSEWKKRFYRRFSCSVQCFAVIIVRKRTKFAEFKITREFRTKLY